MYFFEFGINPVAASRPRVTRYGTYYGKKYTHFRKEGEKVVDEELSSRRSRCRLPLLSDLSVTLEFNVLKPKTSKLEYPRPDIDNYLKAIFDLLNEKLYNDDRQVIHVEATKKFVLDSPSIKLWVKKYVDHKKAAQ